MMIQSDREQTDVPISVVVDHGGGVTGLTIVIRIFQGTDFLDFNDGVFKAAGHVTPTLALTEVDATEAPGFYEVAGGFDLSAITIAASTLSLAVHYDITAGTVTGSDVDTIQFFDRPVDLIWDEVNRGADHNIKDSTGKQQRQASGTSGAGSEDVVSATATTVELAATESAIDEFLQYREIAIVDGTGVGQIRVIESYVGATRIATLDRAWTTTPVAGDDYLLLLSARTLPDPDETVDAVWDEDIVAAHGTADTAGLLVRALGALISQRANNPTLDELLNIPDVAATFISDAIDTELSANHGAGAWDGTLADWTAAEREQIRFRLAMDGVQTDPTTGVGTIEDILADTNDLVAATIADELAATAGSSSTEVRTGATQADGFYDELILVVVNSAGVVARRISGYLNTNGAFTVAPALPFTPIAADPVFVLNRLASSAIDNAAIADAVWDEDIVGAHGAADAAGLLLRVLGDAISDRSNNATLDALLGIADSAGVSVESRINDVETDTQDIQGRLPAALVGGRMDSDVGNMQTDVLDAAALATSAVNEIRDSILSDSTPFDGADIAAILVDTDVTIPGLIAALNDPTASAVADAVWDEILTGGTHNTPTSAGRRLRQLSEALVVLDGAVVDVTPAASNFDTGVVAVDDFHNDAVLIFISGALAGQSKPITTYTAVGGNMAFDEPFTSAPANGDTFLILTGHVHPLTQIVDAVWSEALPGSFAPGEAGERLATTDDRVDQSLSTTESNIRGGDSRDLTNLAGAGWVAADNLTQAHNKLDILQADIDNFENITKVKVSLPTFEIPTSGSTAYEFFFNLKDSAGDPVDADGGGGGTITLEATAHGGVAGDRDVNLSSTTMTNIGTGRYRGIYNVASSHALEGIHLTFSWAEGGNADVLDKSFTVLDSDMVGYLASDRTRDDQIAVETAAILVDTDVTIPATLSGMSGAGFATGTDSLEAIRNRGDIAWITAVPPTVGDIADAVWDELTAGHTAPGSFGLNLDDQITDVIAAIAALNDLDATEVENAVWDASQASHLAAGSTGESLDDASASSATDWSTAEREQIRDALGVTGTKTTAVGGQLQAIGTRCFVAVIAPSTAGAVTVQVIAWLERNGAQVTAGLTGATVEFKLPDGTNVFGPTALTGPNADGVFRASVAAVTLVDVTNYYAEVVITDATGAETTFQSNPTLG